MKCKYDNSTQYKIDNLTERYILIGYRVLLSISVLIGDTLILVGSLKYNAIKLHKILVIFVQHMAIADILLTLFGIIPGAVSLAANDWILGDVICYLSYIINDTSAVVLSMLTAAIATTKMLIIKYPLRAINFSTQAGHVAAICIWIASSSLPAAALLKDNQGIYFNYLLYICDYTASKSVWDKTSYTIYTTTAGTAGLMTIVGTVLSSVVLLILAKRATVGRPEGLQWQGVLTVLLTAATHTISALSLAIYYILACFEKDPTEFYRYSWWVSQVVVVVNFYIFGLTLPSFRGFLRKLGCCCGVISCLGGRSEDEEERQSLIDDEN